MHIRSALVTHLRNSFIQSLILRSGPRDRGKEGLIMSHRELEVDTSDSRTRPVSSAPTVLKGFSLPGCSSNPSSTLPTWATLSAEHLRYTFLKCPTDSVSDAACKGEDPSARNKERICFSSLLTAEPHHLFPSFVDA